MKRFHVNLRVENLANSVTFYSALFGQEPSVLKADYAKWLLSEPALNFSVSQQANQFGIEHLGLQVEEEADMVMLRNRAQQAEGKLHDEGHTTCCYAMSDKTWVEDPQGVAWELFRTYGESSTYRGKGVATACCTPGGG